MIYRIMSSGLALRPAEHLQFLSESEGPDDVLVYPLTWIGMTVLRVMDKVRMEAIAEHSGQYPVDLEKILDSRIIGMTAIMTRNDFEQTIGPFICPEMPDLLAKAPFPPPCQRMGIN